MAPAPRSEGENNHLSRRLLQLAGVLAVVLIVTVVFAWLHGGDEASLNPIAQAAARTQEAAGGRTSFHATVRGDSQPHPITTSGVGVFNSQMNRSQLTMTVPTPDGRVEMEGVGSGSQMYFKSELLQPRLPSGDEWLGLDASLGSASETAVAANADPTAQLDLLRAVSDEFKMLGEKKIRGEETTGYRSKFDLDDITEYLRGKGSGKAAEQYERIAEAVPTTTEVVVWIDAKGLVRRMTMTGESQDPSSGEVTSTETTADFYDFGISPDIQLPDPDTVYDVTPMIRAKLGLDSSS
jgi:hypothetical protein